MSNTTSPALPPFSYAQAARGLTPSNQGTAKSPEPGTTPADQSSRDPKSANVEPGKLDLASNILNHKAEKTRESSSGSDTVVEEHVPTLDEGATNKENLPPIDDSTSSMDETNPLTSASSASLLAEATTQHPKVESPSLQQNEASDAWDKQSELSTYVEKSTQTAEKAKSKDSEDDWEKVSASAIPSERELRPAPIPVVNFWTQRSAQIAAKVKDPATQQRPIAVTSNVATSRTKPRGSGNLDGAARKPTDKNQPSIDKDTSGTRKKQETTRPVDGARRDQATGTTSRPGSQPKDSAASLPPPVGDAESWPTPDTAAPEERRKSTTLEKSDKLENKAIGSKSHANKWTPVPYVPSVVFETQLPPAAARRGGRPNNRGREGTGRGAFNTNNGTAGEKIDATNMPPPPLPRQQHDQDRGRKNEASRGGRAASVPTQGKRETSVTDTTLGVRKASEAPGRDLGSVPQPKSTVSETPAAITTPENPTATSAQDQRSLSRPATNVVDNANSDDTAPGQSGESLNDTHAHPASHVPRQSSGDWVKGTTYKSPRNMADLGRENPFKSRDLPGDRAEAASSRAKVESWRDREAQPDPTGRRESRPDRGRGGLRGSRGASSTYGAHPAAGQSFTSPLPQQAFPGAKPSSFHDNRHRQGSQPYTSGPLNIGNRNNPRSQSIPVNNMYQPFPNGTYGMNQPLSPLQTDLQMYQYPQMHMGSMSAMPYSSPLENYALISMVTTQVEYYFSIDNLCKDMFLRRNMDSQGWVSLSVIANFKRIRSLIDDMNLLRSICAQLKGVEFLPGENGQEDRLRSREKWNEFVLEEKDRLVETRNDGPSQQTPMAYIPFHNGLADFNNIHISSGQLRSPSWNQATYGVNAPKVSPTSQPMPGQLDGSLSETPMSPNISNYFGNGTFAANGGSSRNNHEHARSPSGNGINGSGPNNLTNGYHFHGNSLHEETEDVFPDDGVPALRVVFREFDNIPTTSQPTFLSNSTRTFSNGSINGSTDLRMAEMSISRTVSGLRGGAGSPEQLERLQMPSSSLLTRASQPDPSSVFWVKEGAPPVGLHEEGMVEELYVPLRERALQGRQHGDSAEYMDVLYDFWSHFLVRNFNVAMYEEFHTLALEDLQKGLDNGSKHLVRYYEALLTGRTTISNRLVQDIVTMAADEPGEARLAFQKLRAAWRNGAMDFKSRSRINKILTPSLRADLEK